MIYEERWYQIEAEKALYSDLLYHPHLDPVVAIPTGGGKTKVIGSTIYNYLETRPNENILVLSHTEDIVYQDHKALSNFYPGINLGLYSAGLKSKTIQKITVAGIQSVYKSPEKFTRFNLAMIDEAHTIPTKGEGMYRTFLSYIGARKVGFTATPFRSKHGYIYKGEGALFNHLSYDLTSMDNFNRLVSDGYLTKLISKSTEFEMDAEGVKITAGDYNRKALSDKFDRGDITKKAVAETIECGHNYKSWLVFAIDTDHADSINKELNARGIDSEVLHSKLKVDRRDTIDRFKARQFRALVSVGMITTGFDAPNVDLIVLLRPTKSPVLHVQMIGRGSRPYLILGKTHCLVLDFAGNIDRLGPINAVTIPDPTKKKKGKGAAVVKRCPKCTVKHHPSVKVCDVCSHVFEFEQKIKVTAGTAEVIRTIEKPVTKWVDVYDVVYSIHRKKNSPNSLKVVYICGVTTVTDWVCYDHSGRAGYLARHWVNVRWQRRLKPETVEELFIHNDLLKKPLRIQIAKENNYLRVKDYLF